MASLLDPTSGQVLTPDMLDQRRKLAQQLFAQQKNNYAQPGGAWMGLSDGASKIGSAIMETGLEGRQFDAMKSAADQANSGLDSFMGGLPGQPGPMPGTAPKGPQVPGDTGMPNFGGGPGALPNAKPNPYPTTQPAAGGPQASAVPFPGAPSATGGPSAGGPSANEGMDRWKAAISNNESGGRYDLLGPVIPKTGDRAYGKYQVMGNNVPEWTKAALGSPMTKEQFLASPDAQEKVFQHQFGGYVAKYGNPEDAASAWFTGGPRTAKSMAATDPLGTSGAGYVNKFDRFLGQPSGMVAQAQPAGAVSTDVPPQNAQVTGQSAAQPQFGANARNAASMSGTDLVGSQPFGPPGAPLPPQPPMQFQPQGGPQGAPMGGQGAFGGQDPRQAVAALRPLMAALSNPWTPPAQAKLIEAMIQPYLAQLGPVNYSTVQQPDGSVWAVNPRNPTDARQIAPATKHYISVAGDFGRHRTIDEFSGQEAPGQQPVQGAAPQPAAGGPQQGGDLVQGVDIIPGPGGIPMLSPTGLAKIGQSGDTVPWFQDPANGFWKRSDGTGILSPLALQQKIQATAAERRSQPVTTRAGATTSGTIEDAIAGMNAPGFKAPTWEAPKATGNRVDDAMDYYGQRDVWGQSNAIPGMAGGKVVTVDFPEPATEARKKAQDIAASAADVASLQAEQAILKRNLDVLNNQGASFQATGTGGRERANIANAVNTIFTLAGVKDEDLPFDAKQGAAAADITKIATLQGLQNSRIAGAREAQAIVQQSINATANMENSPSQNNLVLADMMQIAQQKMDLAKFASKYISKYPKSDGISLTEAFVEAYPPEEYANNAIKQAQDWDAARAKAGAPPPDQVTQAQPAGTPGAAQAATGQQDFAPHVALLQQMKAAGADDATIQQLAQAKGVPAQVVQQALAGSPPAAPPAAVAPPQGVAPPAGAPAPAGPPQPVGQPPQPVAAPQAVPLDQRTADIGALTQGTPSAGVATQPRPFLPPPAPTFDPEQARQFAEKFLGAGRPQYQFNPASGNPVQGMNTPQAATPPPPPPPRPASMFGPPIQPLFGGKKAPPQAGPDQGLSVSPEAGQNTPAPQGASAPIRTTTQGTAAIKAGQNPTAVAKALLLGGIDPGRAVQALVLGGVPPDTAKSIVAAAQRQK